MLDAHLLQLTRFIHKLGHMSQIYLSYPTDSQIDRQQHPTKSRSILN